MSVALVAFAAVAFVMLLPSAVPFVMFGMTGSNEAAASCEIAAASEKGEKGEIVAARAKRATRTILRFASDTGRGRPTCRC